VGDHGCANDDDDSFIHPSDPLIHRSSHSYCLYNTPLLFLISQPQ
jgi:hypothetical protein